MLKRKNLYRKDIQNLFLISFPFLFFFRFFYTPIRKSLLLKWNITNWPDVRLYYRYSYSGCISFSLMTIALLIKEPILRLLTKMLMNLSLPNVECAMNQGK